MMVGLAEPALVLNGVNEEHSYGCQPWSFEIKIGLYMHLMSHQRLERLLQEGMFDPGQLLHVITRCLMLDVLTLM